MTKPHKETGKSAKPSGPEVPAELSDEPFLIGAAEDISDCVAQPAPFVASPQPRIRRDGDTEDLLNGLIAECHYMIRAVALPSASRTVDPVTRQRFLGTMMDFANTGARLGKTVAKLRAAERVIELSRHEIIEQVARTVPAPALGKNS